jgi:hypothetical protein
MRSMRNLLLSGALALTAILAACSDTTSPADGELTATEAEDAGLAQADEVADLADAINLEDAAVAEADVGTAPAMSFDLMGPPHASCATTSSLLDSDGDGTPDDATFVYAPPACHFTGYEGGTLDLTGTIEVSDPTPEESDWSRLVDLTDFTFKFSGSQRAFVAVRNGHRQRSGNAESLVLQNDVTVERTRQGREPATIVHTLQAVFTPAEGSSLEPGSPLPDGTISISGTLTWSRNARSHVFTATTTVPLQYDSSCTGPRRDRIAAGEIRWALPGGRTIVTTWTGCGVPPTRRVVDPAS